MMGKTHFKVGVLSYAIISTVPAFGGNAKISLVNLAVAGVAALMADADSQHSSINHMNPITGSANKAIDLFRDIIEMIVRLGFTLGLAWLIIEQASYVKGMIGSVATLRPYAEMITYGAAAILVLMGLSGKKGNWFIRKIPVIGGIYRAFISLIYNLASQLKRAVMFIVYAGIGVWIIYYNLKHYQDNRLNLIGVLFIGIAVFPHRSFLHSIEGFTLFTLAVGYLANKIGHSYLLYPFMIGYGSHLYLSDIFTNEGVPLSSVPMILKKLRIDQHLRKYSWYSMIMNVLEIRLKVPLMSTGTAGGHFFEYGYVVILAVAAAASFMTYNGSIRLI